MAARKRSPLQAIRAKCIECCCGQKKEVRLCPNEDCSLYQYRFGKKLKEGESGDDNDGE